MARRIDIELTSARPDGSWTWRAAGALKPRGVLEGALLYDGAKAGDVVRADAEFEVEGITIVGVLPPKEKKRSEPERLEVVGPPRDHVPGVTSSLTSRPEQRRDRPDGGPRPPRRDGDAGARRDGERTGQGRGPERGGAERGRTGGAERGGADRGGAERGGRSLAAGGDRPGRDRPARERPSGPPREPAGRDATRRERPARPSRPPSDERAHGERGDRPSRPNEADTAARSKARRLNPGSVHRTSVLESLPPEERPIAEQVLRGGIPAVRTAIHLEREKATVEGRLPPNAEALLAIAEALLPRLKAAEWLDRAEAAAKIADELALRDLRSVVAGADVARDDQSRQLAVQLREALESRVNAQRQEWLDDVTANLNDGRVVRALRVSARPPDPGSRFPAELASRLAEVAGEAMAPDTPPERWAALLEAVAASPVRRSVKPAGLPPEPGEALLHAARQSSGRIPALAPMLGISMPPPPGPARPVPRPPRPSGRPGGPGRPTARPAVPAPPVPPARAAARPDVAPETAAAPPGEPLATESAAPVSEPVAVEAPAVDATGAQEPPAEPVAPAEPAVDAPEAEESTAGAEVADEPAVEPAVAEEPPAEPLMADELVAEPTVDAPAAAEEPAAERDVADETPAEPAMAVEPVVAAEPALDAPAVAEEPPAEAVAADEWPAEHVVDEAPAGDASAVAEASADDALPMADESATTQVAAVAEEPPTREPAAPEEAPPSGIVASVEGSEADAEDRPRPLENHESRVEEARRAPANHLEPIVAVEHESKSGADQPAP